MKSATTNHLRMNQSRSWRWSARTEKTAAEPGSFTWDDARVVFGLAVIVAVVVFLALGH